LVIKGSHHAANGVTHARTHARTHHPTTQGQLGELVPGAAADLLLVEGDPLEDIGLLAASSNVLLVVKDGLLAKVGLALCVCAPAAARVDAGGVCMRPGSDTDAQAVVGLKFGYRVPRGQYVGPTRQRGGPKAQAGTQLAFT
jgi:hypothetical protein